MDSVTHTLFGLAIYGGVDKREMTVPMKRATLFTAIVGSHIPDIDVISQLWDTEGQYQMWHRGITHSIFMVPIWAIVLVAICYFIWGVKDKRLFYLGLFAVFVHNTADIFNAWGTGYFEPFSSVRLTFGTIPIVDFVIWALLLGGFLYKKINKAATHRVYHFVGIGIALHIIIQSLQGYVIYQQYSEQFEQHTLSASFIPWNFSVIGTKEDEVQIIETNLWGKESISYALETSPDADLKQLFEQVPEAKTLYEWSPFVVIVDDNELLGIYDPRFYRNGQSFLFEYIKKQN